MNALRLRWRKALIIGVAGIAARMAGPAYASTNPEPSGGTVVAPLADGTNGANDGPASLDMSGPVGITPYAATVCEPNSVYDYATSATKSGKVTAWTLHIRNDSAPETMVFKTTSVYSLTAHASVSGTIDAGISFAKVAQASLGITTGYGIEGNVATTKEVSQTVSWSTPGKWVIFGGVYKGTGTGVHARCTSNGLSATTLGTASVTTFDKGQVTGLINCANSVTGLVAVDAKTKCG